jgi:hypothetical protein
MDVSDRPTFERTLPLFDDADRNLIQRLLHHAVEDLGYDHPDRKLARDLYHDIHEGDAIRLRVGTDIRDETLVIAPGEVGTETATIVERYVADMQSETGEWAAIRAELDRWREEVDLGDEYCVAFEYLQ